MVPPVFSESVHLTLNSQVARLSQEIVNLKERNSGSAGSTVAASSGNGGSTCNFSLPTPTSVEFKDWKVRRNICSTGITWMKPNVGKWNQKP